MHHRQGWTTQGLGLIVLLCICLLLHSSRSLAGYPSQPNAQTNVGKIPKELEEIGIDSKLGAKISVDELSFKNEEDEVVKLSRYFDGKTPVILNLVYFKCPSLCNFLLNGLMDSLKKFNWSVGKQFKIVTISINPREKPKLAKAKKKNYLAQYNRTTAEAGWHFLTGEESQIKKLTSQVGFKYRYDQKQKEYAHGAAIWVLTPEAKISRVLYGIQFGERDLRLALVEASDGKIGSIIDRVLLFCYHYDPQERKYSLVAFRLVQAGSAGILVLLGGYLIVFWRRENRRLGSRGKTEK